MDYQKTRVAFMVVAFCQIIGTLRAEITFSVRFLTFENSIGQCDPDSECDHQFTVCLGHYNSRETDFSSSGCTFFVNTTGTFPDMNTITFGDDMQTLSNPVVIHVPDIEEGIHVKVLLWERDHIGTTTRRFLKHDWFSYKFRILKVPTVQSSVQIIGSPKVTRLTMDLSASCTPPYYLSSGSCGTFCEGRDDQSGHYTCRSDGMKECIPGWIDISQDCTVPQPTCQNVLCANGGVCQSNGQCACQPGYSGPTCQGVRAEPSTSGPAKTNYLAVGLIVGFSILAIIVSLAVTILLVRRKRNSRNHVEAGDAANTKRSKTHRSTKPKRKSSTHDKIKLTETKKHQKQNDYVESGRKKHQDTSKVHKGPEDDASKTHLPGYRANFTPAQGESLHIAENDGYESILDSVYSGDVYEKF